MRFLKGLALSLLNFLLFLSLTVFGIAVTLNYTLLSPGFVTSELDRLDVASLTEVFLGEEAAPGEFPEEFRIALVDTVTKLEPLLKEQVSAATYSVYDYLLGESQSLDLALVLRGTILNAAFVSSLVNELDVSSLVEGFLTEKLTTEVPKEAAGYLVDYIDDVVVEFEPWIKEQVIASAEPIFDYLLGRSQTLSVVISLEPVKESLENILKGAFLESLPPELAGLPRAELERYVDELSGEVLAGMIPPSFEVNEGMLGPEIPAQITAGLTEAENGLAQARQYVGSFQFGYKALIALILLLILGIVLINRQVRASSRGIGVTFLAYGAIEYGGILVGRYFAVPQMAYLDIPLRLETWLVQLVDDILYPLQMFSLGLLIVGIVLIVISYLYKRREYRFESADKEGVK